MTFTLLLQCYIVPGYKILGIQGAIFVCKKDGPNNKKKVLSNFNAG